MYRPLPYSGDYDEAEEAGGAEDYAAPDQSRKVPEFVQTVVFKGPFPESSSFVIEMPKNLRDDAGRALANADRFPLPVQTDQYPPLAKFSSRFGIIELNGDATLPVTLRNLEVRVPTRTLTVEEKKPNLLDKAKEAALEALGPEPPAMLEGLKGRMHRTNLSKEEQVIEWLRLVAAAGRRRSVFKGAEGLKEFGLPKPGGQKAFEVVGILLREPGFYIVELESRILGSSLLGTGAIDAQGIFQKNPLFVPTAALVTNLAVHFKKGRESSLAWVTTLDKAEPVRDASVSVRDCTGKEVWRGRTDSLGIARIRKSLPEGDLLPTCSYPRDEDSYYDYPQLQALRGMDGGLFVFAKKEKDMTFVHSGWDDGIEPWRYNLPAGSYRSPILAHTVMDRTLLRAGETVQMKHLVRKHTTSGFALPPANELPEKVLIEHLGGETKFEFPLKWDARGIAETALTLPPEAKLGHYAVNLTTRATKKSRGFSGKEYNYDKRWPSGQFRVEEFRVPLMKGLIQPPPEPALNAPEIEVDLMVSYLSGGGAGNAEVKLRSTVQPRYLHFDDYDDFVLANGMVKEGIERRSGSRYDDDEGQVETPKARVMSSTLTLDLSGARRTKIGPLPKFDTPQEVAAELEFRDPNGEVQTVSSRIPLWTSRVLVGIKPDSWATSKESFRFHLLALDWRGKPVSGVPISAELFQRKYYTHRKRLIGGFYSYEHVAEIKKIAGLCEGVTDGKGLVICQVKSPVAGNVIIQARAKDAGGNISAAHRDVWVYGKGEWWFDVADNDRIDLLPEKKRYEPGETAKFQVRMPFRSATVLVTTEREGIMEVYVRKLSGAQPVIEVPIKGSHAPNLFVSALCVRGRVEGVKPTALVDLGKPAFKLGMAEIKVGWKDHELKVAVSPERDIYRIREKALVKVKVNTTAGKSPPRGTEVALAAVDEGLLELMPNASWKLLEAMMTRRGCEVRTATAQMQVVGKRHYGIKALPPGGGGGKQTTRELFDTLLVWKARVKLDEKGEANVDIPLNDTLGSFLIVAVANGAYGLFGTGQASIRTTQDLMLLSGLPPLVREGDSFHAGFTVRNSSPRSMEVNIAASTTTKKTLAPLSLFLQPGEAKSFGWDTAATPGNDALSWEVTARERSGEAADTLKVRQKVIAVVPVATYQATIAQVRDTLAMAIEKPPDAQPGRGGIKISLKPSLAAGLTGITEYMTRYPYTCFEQKVSIAIALRDKTLWSKVMALLPSHLDGDGLLKYFPLSLTGSDVLTAYVLSIAAEAGWTIPERLAERMAVGLAGFVEGRVIRHSALPTADLAIRKIAALEALSRRQEIAPRILTSISLEPNLWPTSAVLDWMNLLLRAKQLPDRAGRLREAEQIIRSRLNFQGTTMGFSTEKTDYLWWLMVNNDANAVRCLLTLLELENWRQDMPRLVRGAVGRQHRGRWDTTVANAWGVLALEKFSKKFESVSVTGKTAASVARQEKSLDWSQAAGGGSLLYQWPETKSNLAVSHHGSGSPWVTIQSLAAIPLKESLSSGFRMKKHLTPVSRKEKDRWSAGDVLRVTLELESQADMTWVAVNDPVPAGSSILGTGLGRDSALLTREEKSAGWVWPAFEERSFEAFRAYYEYVPKGKWTVEYTLRLNNQGSFQLPETRVEALYSPEMFGMMPNRKMDVGK